VQRDTDRLVEHKRITKAWLSAPEIRRDRAAMHACVLDHKSSAGFNVCLNSAGFAGFNRARTPSSVDVAVGAVETLYVAHGRHDAQVHSCLDHPVAWNVGVEEAKLALGHEEALPDELQIIACPHVV